MTGKKQEQNIIFLSEPKLNEPNECHYCESEVLKINMNVNVAMIFGCFTVYLTSTLPNFQVTLKWK